MKLEHITLTETEKAMAEALKRTYGALSFLKSTYDAVVERFGADQSEKADNTPQDLLDAILIPNYIKPIVERVTHKHILDKPLETGLDSTFYNMFSNLLAESSKRILNQLHAEELGMLMESAHSASLCNGRLYDTLAVICFERECSDVRLDPSYFSRFNEDIANVCKYFKAMQKPNEDFIKEYSQKIRRLEVGPVYWK